MKFLLLVLIFINIVPIFCEAEYECKKFVEFLKTGGYEIREDCCNEPGIECKNDSIFSIDLTLKPGTLDFDYFPKFSNLDKLSIKGDVYQGELPVEYFSTGIRILDISNSKIKSSSWYIALNFSLEELYLNDNEIESFPYIFSELLNLKILNLDNNKISGTLDVNTPTGVNNLKFVELEKLSLQNNQMEGELIYPGTLTYLNIQNNKFSSLKNNSKENALRELNLNNNLFSNTVFDQLKSQFHIKKLELRNNKNISFINEHIGKLTDLEYLDLSSNNLENIHSNLYMLTNLKHFDISDNPKLNTRILNFDRNNQIKSCNFTNTNISCYEPDTCENIKNVYATCIEDEVKTIKLSQIMKKSMSVIAEIFIELTIAFFVFLILATLLVCFLLIICDDSNLPNNNNSYSPLPQYSPPPPQYCDINTPLLSNEVNNYLTIETYDDSDLPTYEEAIRSDSNYNY